MEIYAGSLDFEMTELGRKQCEMTAEHLKNWRIDRAFASPLSRSIEVSSIVFHHHRALREIGQTAQYFLRSRGAAAPELKTDQRITEKVSALAMYVARC